jgi:long-subunit acyl-CoA synthetase (AMP-forming)
MSAATHLAPPFGEVRKPASIGPAIPGTQCRLVDPDTGEDAGPGERGELWMRSPRVMQGYLNNPEATAALIDHDGWLHTGDIAVVDEAGWFTIVGRIKEMIKYKGFQVAPAELEAILITHPNVADGVVIGIPDEEALELPKAFIVPAGGELGPGITHPLRRRAGRPVQAHPRDRVRGGDPEVTVREDSPARTREPRTGCNSARAHRRPLTASRPGRMHDGSPGRCQPMVVVDDRAGAVVGGDDPLLAPAVHSRSANGSAKR